MTGGAGALAEIARRLAWAPATVLAAHVVLAHADGDLYRRWPWLDVPVHLAGGAAVAYLVAGGLAILGRRGLIACPDPAVRAALSLSATCAAAMLWEIAEWLADRGLGTRYQPGLDDTVLDMALGLAGALALLAGRWAQGRLRP